MPHSKHAGSLSEHARTNMRAWRREAGYASAAALAERLNELGVKASRDTIASLENGRREEVTLGEVAALALALNVAPVDLVLPSDESLFVDVAEGVRERAIWVRAWWRGEVPLPPDPAPDHRFFRKAPPGTRRRRQLDLQPLLLDLNELQGYVMEALEAVHLGVENNSSEHPQVAAAALRRQLEHIDHDVERLAERLERLEKETPHGRKL